MHRNGKPRLLQTFGPEIEAFWEYTRDHATQLDDLAKDNETIKNRILNGTYIRHDLTDRLVNEGIKAQTEDKNESYECQKGYQHWTIEREVLFHPDPLPEGASRISIEVISRILNYDESGFNEVERVLHVMGEYTNPPFIVNTATGLHVHVGSNQPYTLPWLKGFCQLVTAFEHEIEALHPDHRVRPEPYDFNEYCAPPSNLPRLFPREGPVVGIAVLESCQDIRSLQKVFSPSSKHTLHSKYTAYNILNIGDTNSGNPKQTIEFRQHAGSLDAEEILHWVDFVGALVRYAYYADHEELLRFCMKHLRDWQNGGRYTVFGLMKTIGVSFLIPYYTPKVNFERPRRSLEDLPESVYVYSQRRPNTQFLYDLVKELAVEETATASGSDDIDDLALKRER